MNFKTSAKLYLIACGFTQGGTKSTEDSYAKEAVEIRLFDNSFEHRRVVAGNISERVSFQNATVALLTKTLSVRNVKIFLPENENKSLSKVA